MKWLKLHALIDAESKTVLTWSLTDPGVHDTRELANLLHRLRSPVRELYADAGYLSHTNCIEARAVGATPYIRTKKTTRRAPPPNGRGAHSTPFHAMVWAYQSDPDAWMKRYGRRNRVESTFAAIKRRLGGRLAALGRQAIRIEASLKLVAWNLTRIRNEEF